MGWSIVTEARSEIAHYVEDHPGAHFSAIVDDLDQATGQVQHHISRLVRGDELEQESIYGQTHYYPPGYDDWEKEALALLRRETSRAILAALFERDGRKPGALADELGVARSTLEYHLDRLVEQDVVEKRRDDHRHVTLHLRRPQETAHLLAEIEPTYGDRFVDRFMRLVDSVFEDNAP